MREANKYTTMSFLSSLKEHVGDEETYIYRIALRPIARAMCISMRRGESILQVYLPKYSLELNVIEEVFRKPKAELNNKLFASLNRLKETTDFFKRRNYELNVNVNRYLT